VRGQKLKTAAVVSALLLAFTGLGVAASPEQLEQRALDAMQEGEYSKAVGLLEKVLELRPGLARALYNLACCYSRMGELDQAALRLEAAYAAGMSDPELPRTDPDLEALRATRKGRALVERLASEAEKRRRIRGVPDIFEAPILGGLRVTVPREMKEGRVYPLVMILHGHGANPENYVGVFERVASSLDAIVSAPYGPYPIPFEQGHGYSWYPAPWFFRELLDTGNDDRAQRRREVELQEQVVSKQFVLAAIEHVSTAYPVDPTRVFLMGHSEGGVLTYDLGLENPDLFRGLIVIGSRLRESDAAPEALAEAAGGLEVMICHSRQDTAIGFENAEKAAKTLRSAGIESKVYSYEGGHGLTTALIQTIGRWIAARSRD
jgi:phospholipase/carboxylesterase